MTKKALLVAMSDYGIYAPRLTSVPKELARWQKLLNAAPYKFNQIVTLADSAATTSTVRRGLENLFDSASPGDQLLFVFMGHGTVAKGRRPGDADESLLVYPGARGVLDGVIRESEIDRILAAKRPPVGTDITFVLDTCFAANYGGLFKLHGGDDLGALPLFVPLPDDFLHGLQSLRVFGPFPDSGEAGVEKPLVFAASGKDEPAYEIWDNNERRLLFSKRLLARLAQKHETFEETRAKITPLHPQIKQSPQLAGNRSRITERFPGEHPVAAPGIASRSLLEGLELGTADTALLSSTAASINMRVLGLACFVTPGPNDPVGDYKVRLILPYDDGTYVPEINRHFACIEIPEHDIVGDIVGTAPEVFLRGGVRYARWLLDAHTVAIETGDANSPFTPSTSFQYHVPAMTKLCPELRPRNPRPECFKAIPIPDLFAAFVDIPSGSADVGPLDEVDTFFQRPSGPITWGPRPTPISVLANIPIVSEEASIVLYPYPEGTAPSLRVSVRPGSTILVANAREIDISGDGGGTVAVPPEQFKLYYKLSNFTPEDAPLPQTELAPIDACSVTTWP